MIIAKIWFTRCWQWQIGACVVAVTLSVGISERVWAQIVPDNTLGAEGSVVTPNVNIQGIPSDRIDGGAIRGANLFHSFAQFNVGAERGAYFSNPAGIANILSRVTGANRSEILGRLGVLGNANLFLINPQGIVFGPSSSLDVQGSFLATTANAVKLGDAGLFSASIPGSSNLLTVSPSALWFNAIAAQPIVNRSQAQSLINQPNSAGLSPGLQVPPGQTLALVGGNVLLEGGRLTAAGGRIELGSVAGVGEVSLTQSGNRFALGYDSINDFGNISLSNRAFVDASGEGGGDVQIRGARLEMTQSSNIWADTLGTQNGGEILVRATEVVLSESSWLRAGVTGTGTGGTLTIDTRRLLVRDGAVVSAETYGIGKGGRLQINASESVNVIGGSTNGGFGSGLLAQSNGSGDAGELTIDTERLLVRDGAVVSAGTYGIGNGGRLQINASESVEVIGTSADTQPRRSGLLAQSNGSGNAGNLRIDTGRLLVSDGAEVSAGTYGIGNGGRLQINASESVNVIGGSTNGGFGSGLLAQSNGSGDAGELTIDTERLLVRDGAVVSAGTTGEGNGGRLQINASDSVEVIGTSADTQPRRSGLLAQSNGSGDAGDLSIATGRLLVSDGAEVSAGTYGIGNGGRLQINASESVNVIGGSTNGGFGSGLLAQSNGSGDAGELTIDTERLLVRGGAVVSAGTTGEGNGGRLQINASDSVEVIGGSTNGGFGSALYAQSEGRGDAGNLTIDTGRLLVSNGAAVSAGTFGAGNGGNLQITASESVNVIGTSDEDTQRRSGLYAQSNGSGNAGNLRIDTERLLVRDGAEVSVGTFGAGKGGNLQINASDSVEVIGELANGGFPSALSAQSNESGNGDAGNLTIDTGRLLVSNGAVVSAGTFGAGNGGNLQINASDSVNVIGTSTDNTQRRSGLYAQSDGSGNAGNLRIETERLLVRDGAVVSAGTTGDGNSGRLQINASESVEVIGGSDNRQFDSGLLAQSLGSGDGDAGEVTIDTGRLLVRDGAVVSVGNFGAGNGGRLQINASDSVNVIGTSKDGQRRSGLLAQSDGSRNAGELTIETERLLVRDGAVVSAGTTGEGNGGNLQINASDSVEVIGGLVNSEFGSGLLAQSEGGGDAGNLTIDTGRLLVSNGAVVSAGTFGAGNGGNLQINASDSVEVIGTSTDNTQRRSGLYAQSNGSGNAGNLRIDTERLLVRDGAEVSAGTFGDGNGGNLQINASDSVNVIGTNGGFPSALSAQSEGSGDAGDLTIDTERLLVSEGAVIYNRSSGVGTAGNINITARDTLQADNGTISTNTSRSAGGAITITARDIRLSGDSDISSNVASGANNGGTITLTADSILAFDDSDILAYAQDGRGGDINLNTPAFFSEGYRPAPRGTNPDTLDNNNRVDINATAAISGVITRPDTTFIENSLTELPDTQINTDNLLTNSCIVRRNQPNRGSFIITGTGGLPQRPGDAQMSSFPTVDVETLPSDSIASNTNPNRPWQKGDPIVEPQGVYRLTNGKLVLSRECS